MSNLSNLKRTKETVYPCFERYRWAPDNTSLFSQNLDNNQVSTDQNLDSLVNTFSKQILNAMLAADMRIKVRPGRPKSKPWYSRECYLAKKSAKASLTTFKETNTDVDRNIYVSNRKRYTTLINFNKKKYLQAKQELLKNARDSANFWKTIATLKDKSYIQGNITILEWQCFYNKLLSAETTIGSDLSTLSRIDPELYCEISITEITREISSLANEKACGADEIPNEALKTLPFEHLVTLKNIFNRIINSGSYPLIWSKSIIHPIFKSGDRDNPSNYRGIALISNLSKLFTSILKSRLRNWIEGRSIIPENQAGFRKGYSCQDHIFTLLSLIQLTLRRKRRKLYAFFVDLKKAFDTVPHSLLWSKLGELGLDFRFVNLIRNYFEQMTTTVRWNGLFTEPIKIRSGVLQGEPLSPYLFILFVTDLINIFNDSTLPGIYLPNFGTVHLLMYADDIILIGESKINLQIKINMLKKYFETNHLTLNESKSKIMVFRNGGRPAKSDKWFWGDQLLTVTSKYLYLGYPLTTTISFSQVASYFKGKALAATGEVWKIMEKSRLNSFGSSMKLLDSIILSTLLYSAPIWANEKYKILDQIQNNYLRRLLNLPSNTPGYILRMETGRFSLGVTATKLILKFWLRILKMEKSRLPAIYLAQLWETSTLTNAFIGGGSAYPNYRPCGVGDCFYFVVVVVVSKEESQMSPCISITAAAISTILELFIGKWMPLPRRGPYDVLSGGVLSSMERGMPCPRLAPGFHRRVKAKTSLQDDDVPIDDTTTKPLITPQEKGLKGTMDNVPRLRWNPWQKHVRSMNPEKVSQISNLIKENPRIGLRDIEKETRISKSLVGSIIKEDLQLKKTPSKFVPKMLTIQQKENRVEVAKKMLEMVEENPNWKEKVITGDETWVYGYDPETKRQSMEWKGKDEPRTKKSRLCKSKNKVLLATFFDIKGIVHYEYLEEGRTINKESYLNIMRRVRESIRLKKSEMWSSKNWIIHHDNAPPHTATSVLTYLAKHDIQILQQPPYSPDLAPNDFFLFPKLKMALKGRIFDTRESIIADSKKVLKNIPKDAFSKCFKSWEKRWKL
ncbi:hypothetical protein LAZ67_3001027 [Cordylochernes scorpioides]|uniref:Reverse transcriptase domain-containing protein n=1 Tax=Cordylochernes scorpioides TaxID=51811 RepID=A0ABY6K7J1_9ARAC|nr:hypothetical protein LAZ67_3001027 [Cordylochernes scorpioides]